MEQEVKAENKKALKDSIKEMVESLYDWCLGEYVHYKVLLSWRFITPLKDWMYRTFTSKTKQRLDAYFQMLEEQDCDPYDPEDWMYRSYRYLHPKHVYLARVDEKQGKITHELSLRPLDVCSPTCKDFRKAGFLRCKRQIEAEFASTAEFYESDRTCSYIKETNRIVYELQKIAAKTKIYLRRIFGKKILGISLQYDWEVQKSSDNI